MNEGPNTLLSSEVEEQINHRQPSSKMNPGKMEKSLARELQSCEMKAVYFLKVI